MKSMMSIMIAALTVVTGSGAVAAASLLELKSEVFVKRQVVRSDGSNAVVLEKPDMVMPGDNLVFVVRYKNAGGSTANNFIVTNPLPAAVAFDGTSDGLEVVSTDGGKSWGTLGMMRITKRDGTARPAQRADVTHIKWNLNQPLTAGAEGKLIFRGIVK